MKASVVTWLAFLVMFTAASCPAADFIKPAPEPDKLDFAARRIARLEAQAGINAHDFAYSLPTNAELIVTVIVKRGGKVSESDSAILRIKPQPGEQRIEGIITISENLPRGPAAAQPSFYIDVDRQLGYGFPCPKNALNARLVKKELDLSHPAENKRLFLWDFGDPISIEILARTAPRAESKPPYISRQPYVRE